MLARLQHYSAFVFTSLLLVFISAYAWLDSVHIHKKIYYVLLFVSLISAYFHKVRLTLLLKQPIVILISAYFSYQIVSLSWSSIFSIEEQFEVIRKSVLTLSFVAIVAIALLRASFDKIKNILFSIATISALCALVSLFNMPSDIDRLTGIGRALNPNQAGTIYGIGLILSASLLLISSGWQRKVTMVVWLIIFVALLLTQGRGAWLGALSGHIVLLGLAPKLSRKIVISMLSLFVFALIVSSYFIEWQSIIARLDAQRLYIWNAAITEYIEQASLLFGFGYRTPFELALPNGETIYQPHSIYVSAIYCGGLLGLVSLLLVGLKAAYILLKNNSANYLSLLWLSLLANSAVLGAVDYDILLVNANFEWLLFWLPLAGAVAISMQQQNVIER